MTRYFLLSENDFHHIYSQVKAQLGFELGIESDETRSYLQDVMYYLAKDERVMEMQKEAARSALFTELSSYVIRDISKMIKKDVEEKPHVPRNSILGPQQKSLVQVPVAPSVAGALEGALGTPSEVPKGLIEELEDTFGKKNTVSNIPNTAPSHNIYSRLDEITDSIFSESVI